VKRLKHLSDALFVLAVVLLIAGLATASSALYVGAAVSFVLSLVVTAVKRRAAKVARQT
jgi:hypothetical protein